jgi:hypothetical protein
MSQMSQTFYIKTGDRLPSLQVVCLGADGVARDLTGASVTFAVRRKGSRTTLLSGDAVLVTPASGVVRYDWGATDTTTLGPGSFEGEFQVVLSNGKVGTFPGDGYIAIEILRDIAPAPTP